VCAAMKRFISAELTRRVLPPRTQRIIRRRRLSVLKRCVIAQAFELRSGALSHCASSAVCLSFVSFLQQTPKRSPDVSESVIGTKRAGGDISSR
jgi:hypothetical protein